MVVPFDTFARDQKIVEDYRRLDKLIVDLRDVLFHVLTSIGSSSSGRLQSSADDPDFNNNSRAIARRTPGLPLEGRRADRNGLNDMYPDLLANHYRHPRRNPPRIKPQKT